MKKIAMLIVTVSLFAAFPAGSAMAQGAPQSITAKRTDTVQLGSGYRASKLTGANVYDRDKSKLGTIDDLVLSPGEQGAFAILSIGGFLGMGKHLVAIPFNQLQVMNKQLVLPDATADSLKTLPEFKYAPD
jgi:sporulation protein YlmC with PRC-barrel domain